MNAKLFHRIKGSGSPLVLLHPVGLDHSFWGPLIEQAAELHTVIYVDLCGHGQSEAAEPERGIAAYARDVEGLLDQLGLTSAGILGLSFGGMIAQEFAIRNPDRTDLLIVGACGPRIAPEFRDAVRNRGKTDPATGMAGVVDITMERWFTPGFMEAPPAQRVRERLLSDSTSGWVAGWNAIAGFDALDRLSSIKAPTLAISGELDAGAPVAATKLIADTIPGAAFTLLEGAPHMMQIECAERFTDQVIAFLHR